MALNTGSRTGNASRNAASAIINKLVILLLTFINRKVFIVYIGVEYLGINGLFSNVLTLLSMADLGLGTAMNVSLYKPIAENDTKKLAALLGFFRKLYYGIAAGVMVIGLGLLPFLKYIVNLDSDIPHLYVYYIMFVLKNSISYLFAYKSSIIHADQKKYIVNRIDLWVNIAKAIFHIIVVVAFSNYFIYVVVDILAVLAHNLVVSWVADTRYPFIKQSVKLDKAEKKDIFSGTYSVFLYKIAFSLINGTDNILISMLAGTVFVALYSNYYTVTSQIESMIALLFTALTASVGNLVVKENADKRYETFRVMQMVSFWLCGIASICCLFLFQDFIEMLYGAEFKLGTDVLIAIVLNMFFSICMRPVWTFREGTGMYNQIRYIMIVTAVLNIVLSVVLGKILGVSGVLFATSISKISTYFWYEPNLLFKNFFHQSPKKYYLAYAQNAVVLLVTAGLCWIPMSFIKTVSIPCWILKAVICMVIINTVFILRYRKTEEFAIIKKKVAGMFGKKKKAIS